MKKIKYYIGSNNSTKKLEKKKALWILSKYYEGMTTTELVGYWKGESEKTLLAEIVCDNADYTLIKKVCNELCKDLQQEAVMVEVVESNTLFFNSY